MYISRWSADANIGPFPVRALLELPERTHGRQDELLVGGLEGSIAKFVVNEKQPGALACLGRISHRLFFSSLFTSPFPS